MKRFFILIVMLNLSLLHTQAQEFSGLSLTINDSVKKFHVGRENRDIIHFLSMRLFNREIDYVVDFNSNANSDSLHFFLFWDGLCEAKPLWIANDTTRIVEDTLIYFSDGFYNSPHTPDMLFAGNHVPGLIFIDSNLSHSRSLRSLLAERDIVYKLNRNLNLNFGLTYVIEDEAGQVLTKDTRCLNCRHVHYSGIGMEERARKDSLYQIKQLRKLKKWEDKQFESFVVFPGTSKIKIHIPYRKYSRENARNKKYRFCSYYNFVSGKVYNITFFYTFYLNKEFFRQPLDIFYEKIFNSDYYRKNELNIFQGQIKSNTVKLIVK